MKRIVSHSLLVVFAAFTFAGSAFSQDSINQFEWLLGDWKGTQGPATLTESWKKVDETLMLGEGYVIMNGDTAVTELLRIQKIGRFWTYIPIINKGQPVLFTLIESANDKWVFENKEHDFPQRIVYTRKPDGSLLAWIEGEMNGKQMKDEYTLQKVN
jgi:hypothetical protein